MDVVSKNVLLRKDFLLKNYLVWNDELTETLRDNLVLSEKNVEEIRKSKIDSVKTTTLIDRMKCKGRIGTELETVADALQTTRQSFVPEWYNSWVSDELREELSSERSQLIISDDISRECATIVHREFGHTKRLSEHEKKALTQILRERTQLTKNIWQQRCQTVSDDVQWEGTILERKEQKALEISKDTLQYAKTNQCRLPEGQVQLSKRTSKAVLNAPEESNEAADALQALKGGINSIRKILCSSLLAAEWLDKDRIRILRKMDLSEETIMHAVLDEEIRLALERNMQKIAEADAQIHRREGEYEELLAEIQNHSRDQQKKMENKEKNITILEGEVKRSDDRADDLTEQIKAMTRQLKIAKLELNEWVDWYESIDHSRRLNHIYQRDMHKLKPKGESVAGQYRVAIDQIAIRAHYRI